MVRRLLRGGHQCVVYNQTPEPMQALAKEGAIPSSSLSDFASKLTPPRTAWLMIPAAFVDSTLDDLARHLGIAYAEEDAVGVFCHLARCIAEHTLLLGCQFAGLVGGIGPQRHLMSGAQKIAGHWVAHGSQS